MSIVTQKTIVLLPTGAVTETGASAHVVIPWQYTGAIIRAVTTGAAGTSPTLHLLIQRGQRAIGTGTKLPGDPATGDYAWADKYAFTQITGNTTREISIQRAGKLEYAVTDGTLAAGTMIDGPLGGVWRVKYAIGGTNPSFSLTVVAELIR